MKPTLNECMLQTLGGMLRHGEEMHAPVYGCLEAIGRTRVNRFGYFALTGGDILVALLHPASARKVHSCGRIPLLVQRCEVATLRATRQRRITLALFDEEEDFTLRLSRRVLFGGFGQQARHVDEFIRRLQQRVE